MKRRKLDTKNPRVNSLANIFLTLGLFGLIFSAYLIYERSNPQNLSFKVNFSEDQKMKAIPYAAPVAINIESQKIELPIIPSEIRNNKWEATKKGVSYLKTSVIPGEIGNSILYGHNWARLLGNLKKVKPGEKIAITYSDGSVKEFLIEYSIEVKPDNEDILQNSLDKRITLYTCSGFLDSKRLVVVAKLLV